jgi:endonuclease/exonuclease/phosphatase family metal-dependent hydrolase
MTDATVHHVPSAATVDGLGGPQRKWRRRGVVAMTFNVLAKQYEPHHLPDNACAFELRRDKIAAQIDYHSPDVLALSEAQPSSWYRERFAGAYQCLYATKADSVNGVLSTAQLLSNRRDDDDGSALMFKTETLTLVAAHHLRVHDPCGWGPSITDPLAPGSRIARQFALLALFTHTATGKPFYVCGMHMKANNGRSSACAVRVCHLLQLLPAIDAIRATAPLAPLVFLGDFNSPPNTPTMDMILHGHTTIDGRPYMHAPWATGTRLRSAMDGAGDDGNDPEFTILDSSWGDGAWSSVLDYILYEPSGFCVASHVTTPSLASFGADAIVHSGSDHIPLIAELAFVR